MITSIFKTITKKIDKKFSEEKLIVFDYKVIVLLLVCLLSFIVLVGFKIHGSSIAIWNEILPNEQQGRDGLLLGSPKGTRSDEWVVSTPITLNQATTDPRFQLQNENIGAKQAPLLTSVPIAHFSTIFRPQHWGYFFLDTERAFAFYWQIKIFGLFISFFFLLLLLTRNNFWLSVLGSVWLFLSSFTQWWFSTFPEMVSAFCLMFISFIYIIQAKKKFNIVLGGIFLTGSMISFTLGLYPPFQVVLGYLFIALLIGYLIENFSWREFKEDIVIRIISAFSAFSLFAYTLYAYYLDSKETINLVMNTAYPGKRRSVGGGMSLSRYFVGFYNFTMNESKFPIKLLPNMSEISSFLLLYPLVGIGIVSSFIAKRKISSMLIMLIGYILFITCYMFLGFTENFSELSFFHMATTQRAILGLGLASILATVLYMNGKTDLSKRFSYTLSGIIFFVMIFFGEIFRGDTDNFIGSGEVLLVAALVSLLTFFLFQKRKLLFAICLTPFIIVNMKVNPISAGLGAVYNKDVYKFVYEKDLINTENKWAVYGDRLSPNFFIATGLNVFDGAKYAPDLKSMYILDPEKKYTKIYNRYAHIDMKEPVLRGVPPEFKLNYDDNYTIYIAPCSEEIKELGINRVIFNYEANLEMNSCLRSINEKPLNGFWLYEIK